MSHAFDGIYPIGLGTARFPFPSPDTYQSDFENAVDLVLYALDHGVNFIDVGKECVDLFDDTESWERKREKMDTYTDVSRLPYLESCRYCKCLAEDTPRLKPAVQAGSLEELPFRILKSKGGLQGAEF